MTVGFPLEIPFPIGAVVWHPQQVTDGPEFLSCPECAGKLMHVVTLGCGDEVRVKCHHCGPGYEIPTGRIRNPASKFVPSQVMLTAINCVDERGVVYATQGYGLLNGKSLFASREECEPLCARLTEEDRAEVARRECHFTSNRRDKESFSATYWRRERNKLLKQLNSVNERLTKTGL